MTLRQLHILIFLLSLLICNAQTIKVNVPRQIPIGETFRLEYTINTSKVNEDIRIGIMPDGIDVVYGPSRSTQQSYSMVNGRSSSSSSTTFTFMLMGTKNGTFQIPAAHINVGGKTLTSKAVTVTIKGNSKQSGGGTKFYNEGEHKDRQSFSSPRGGANDLFIKVSANKSKVYEQEPVVLTYKVYTLVDITQLQGNMPDLDGFHSQEVPLPQQKTFHAERVGGKTYRCVTWSQYVVFPQKTGVLEIPSITFKGIVVTEKKNVDPFEAFFNGGSAYVESKREIVAPSVKIQVEPLPTKPDNFSGGVGKFTIKGRFDKQKAVTGEPLTLRIFVEGTGNMKLMQEPVISFPKDVDHYDAKISDKTRLTSAGVEGTMIYDYLLIPSNPGTLRIPEVTLTYFDTSTQAYKTIRTQPFAIEVEKGNGTMSPDAQSAQDDIRDIITDLNSTPDSHFAFSLWHFILLLFPFVLFFFAYKEIRKYLANSGNYELIRLKRANRVATRRLSKAEQLMRQGDSNHFYEEVLRTLWGYANDKMKIKNEKLSIDEIRRVFEEKGINSTTQQQFIEAIEECERERYAPNGTSGSMQTTFNKAKNALQSFISQVAFAMVLIVTASLISSPTHAQTTNQSSIEEANKAYRQGNYAEAARIYEQMANLKPSLATYYNLGNAYYRLGETSKALVNYERALLISPSDENVRANIDFVKSKIKNGLQSRSEMFFLTWFKWVRQLHSADSWAWRSIVYLIVALVLTLSRLIINNSIGRKGTKVLMYIFFALSILSIAFAASHLYKQKYRPTAIVNNDQIEIKSSPSASSKTIRTAVEGTYLIVIDPSLKGWCEVETTEGQTGWVEQTQISIIQR